MRRTRLLASFATATLLLTAACADSPTAPQAAAPAPAFSGGSTSSGGGSTSVKVAGQWSGAFQTILQYDSKVALNLSQSGSTVTGTIVFTYNYVPGQLQSAVKGTWDGTTLKLYFNAPNGAGFIVSQPSAHARYGTAFVALVESQSNPSSTLGTLNIAKL